MRKLLKNITLASLSFAFFPLVNASVVYSEDFEEYTPGNIVGADKHDKWFRTTIGSEHYFEARTDSSNIFGANNQFGYMADTSNTNGSINIFNASSKFSSPITSGQLSFDFYDPSSAPHANNGYLLRIGQGTGNGGTAFGIFIRNGEFVLAETSNVNVGTNAFGSYELNKVNRLDIVFNNSSSTLVYEGGVVLARSMNIYLNGVLLGKDLGTAGGLGADSGITHFDFTAKVSTNPTMDFMGTLFLDNIVVDSTPSIPESGAYALGLSILVSAVFALRQLRLRA